MHGFLDWIQSSAALIGALGSLIGAVVAMLLLLWPSLRRKIPRRGLRPEDATVIVSRERLEHLVIELQSRVKDTVDAAKTPEVPKRIRNAIDALENLVRDRAEERMHAPVSSEAVNHMTVQALERLQGSLIAHVRDQLAGSPNEATASAVNALLQAPETLRAVDRAFEEMVAPAKSKRRRLLISVSVVFQVLTVLLITVYCWPQPAPRPAPPDLRARHEIFTSEAWDAYEKEDWAQAKEYAEKCVTAYESAAATHQEALEKEKAPLPKRRDWTEKDKQAIFKEGVLNDVATCYWILGCSSKNLNDLHGAISAFERCATFTYAATWDTRGWFWFPAEDAASRLEKLRPKRDRK